MGNLHKTPLFVAFGFDDNGISGFANSGDVGATGGMTFVLDMLKSHRDLQGNPLKASFFLASNYILQNNVDDPFLVKQTWQRAYEEGHEIGNHTRTHSHGNGFTVDKWKAEMKACNNDLTSSFVGIGISKDNIVGFRTPFLEYNDAAFEAAQSLGFVYDCSIEEGFLPNQDGTNFPWPYVLSSRGLDLWELPVYAVIVPPDEECKKYGVEPGMRAKMKERQDYFDVCDGKITGFDYNLWVLFKMTKAEFVATLKYSLDLRLKGNRAPFMLGGHTDIYSSAYLGEIPNATASERQDALNDFLDHALGKPEVQVVSFKNVLDWVRNPITG